jgi:dTDP-4-amino-4,6-dideoxygalactose transaminase
MTQLLRRREMLAATAAAAALPSFGAAEKPALLGGRKVREQAFQSWPVFDTTEEQALVGTLRTGAWYRGTGTRVKQFEQAFAQLTGAKRALATANGTSALIASLNALGVEAGDEVILPPYTFIATANVVLRQFALPVFVDTDARSFQIDAGKIEAAITDRTTVLMPVHMGGSPADLDTILAVGAKHKIPVVEDACQAHLAEWKGRKVGTLGTTGCFSFQASKNLNSGEGGTMLTNDEAVFQRAYAYHNSGTGLKGSGSNFTYTSRGSNLRLCEFQGSILLAQMTRLEAQSRRRAENGVYLSSILEKIPGIEPARLYPGSASAYHVYMMRYRKEHFAGLSRATFLKAMAAEGIPVSGGYSPLNRQAFIKAALEGRGYKRLFPAKTLNEWAERTACPVNDKLTEEAVWLTQEKFLGPRSDMDQIAEAILKIQAHATELAKA